MSNIIQAYRDIAAAGAIVSCFETGRPHGKTDAVAVLRDDAGVSYGKHMATDRADSLDAIVKLYVEKNGKYANQLAPYIGELAKNTKDSIRKLSRDEVLKSTLRKAGLDPIMIECQNEVFRKMYMGPAIKECELRGYVLPLSLAVIYDSKVHGSFKLVSDRVVADKTNEKQWITCYLAYRRAWLANHTKLVLQNTVYRSDTFLALILGAGINYIEFAKAVTNKRTTASVVEQIAQHGNWSLVAPFEVRVGKSKITIIEEDLA